jgi:hypothetical protein
MVGAWCGCLTVQPGHWVINGACSACRWRHSLLLIIQRGGRWCLTRLQLICVAALECTESIDDNKPSSESDALEQRT